jgi:hypothetical protein
MTESDDHKSKILATIKILREMFSNSPDKSQIKLNGDCDRCKRKMTIDIVPTSGGYGILGGVLIELTPDHCYRLMCPVCHTECNKKSEQQIVNGE